MTLTPSDILQMKQKSKKMRTSFHIDVTPYLALKNLCKNKGLKTSDVINALILEFITKEGIEVNSK